MKVFQLSTRMAVNTSGKRGLAAMAEGEEPKDPADTAEPPRKVAPGVPIIDSSIDGEPDGLHGEVNGSRQPTAIPGKLWLQLPGLSSAMLAAGPTTLSAETDLRSPFRFVSAH